MRIVDVQTRIEPCEFCREPSVERVEVSPPSYESREGVKVEIKHAVMAHVCATHKESVERDRGWQERAAAQRKAARAELKALTEESKLFDPGPPVNRRKPWEDAA